MSEEYAVLLRKGEWLKKRIEILERDGYHCRDCNNEDNLQVHHCWYAKGPPWETPNEFLVTLCDECHERRQGCENALKKSLGLMFARAPIDLLESSVERGGVPGKNPFRDWAIQLHEDWFIGCPPNLRDYWEDHFNEFYDRRDAALGPLIFAETPGEALQRDGRRHLNRILESLVEEDDLDDLRSFVRRIWEVSCSNEDDLPPVLFKASDYRAQLAKAAAEKPIPVGVF